MTAGSARRSNAQRASRQTRGGATTSPRLTHTPGFGYVARLKDGDVVIEQTTERGVATVWLTGHEFRDLADWFDSDPQPTPAAE